MDRWLTTCHDNKATQHCRRQQRGEVKKNALMILGTASHVGKSILTAGLGRIFVDEGYRVAPFKAQNMSLNSAATQVILLGKVWGQITAWDYHTQRVEQLFPAVVDAYKRLAREHDVILLEGAGSPAEINLREHDIVNMRMAHAADAVCLLVGDIDRGGVFASLLGTLELLEPEDRARIHGFLINKFRGDESLLRPGVSTMERRLGLPCVGIVSYLPNLGLDEEDGVALEERSSAMRRWK